MLGQNVIMLGQSVTMLGHNVTLLGQNVSLWLPGCCICINRFPWQGEKAEKLFMKTWANLLQCRQLLALCMFFLPRSSLKLSESLSANRPRPVMVSKLLDTFCAVLEIHFGNQHNTRFDFVSQHFYLKT